MTGVSQGGSLGFRPEVNGLKPPTTAKGGTSVNIDKCTLNSMSVIPKFMSFEGKDTGTKFIKGVFFAAASPLLLPFMVGYAAGTKLVQAYKQSQLDEREGLIDKANVLVLDQKSKLANLQEQKKIYEETFSTDRINKRKDIVKLAETRYPTPNNWNPMDDRTTKPKDPLNITVDDLQTPKDRYNYSLKTKDYQTYHDEAKTNASNLLAEISKNANDLDKIGAKIAALNKSLGIKEPPPYVSQQTPVKPQQMPASPETKAAKPLPPLPPRRTQQASAAPKPEAPQSAQTQAPQSPQAKILESHAATLRPLESEYKDATQERLMIQGLDARKNLINELRSLEQLTHEDVMQLQTQNLNLLLNMDKNNEGWEAAREAVLAGAAGVMPKAQKPLPPLPSDANKPASLTPQSAQTQATQSAKPLT